MCALYVCSFRIFLPDSHLLWSYNEYLLYYLPLHCPTLLVISHAFYTHAACFKCLKMCVFALLCHAPLCFHKKEIYFPSQWAACVVLFYIYKYVCIYFVVLGKGYLTFVACLQSLNFSLADFFVAFLFLLRFFALLAFFSGKSLNAPSPAEGRSRHRHRLDIYATPSTTWTRTRRAEVAEQQQQQQAAGNMRQDEAGWGSCQILVLVSGCGATCCPGCVHECECVCCDQHCWSTHSHTHTHIPVQTLPGCVVIFFFSVSPAAACRCPHLL